ncbi:MAG: tryptophan--tRNA ligase [Acidobacteria bacterium]|nr:tryptophan--tRNA ligase [Acidobacteriota bacterium]MCB9398299.1 tryptophan--tRNA ligase [Acidobacteriota bacterium]
MKKRVLSGIQPSGRLHLGNYLGAMKQHIAAQDVADRECYYFIANYHSLTSLRDRDQLRELSIDVARTYLALGLDPQKALIFLQSHVPEVCELTWILSTLTPMGLLQRCTSYKDKLAKGIPADHGLFAYPVLQAADILIYNSHLVPVGADQKQHIEVCRDIAQRFNQTYGELLVIPDPDIRPDVAVIPGTDGQKMSKSYKNTIDLFGTPKQLKSQVMSIVTDSKGLEEPKDPDTCHVYNLYKYFATDAEQTEMAARYRAGGYGYGHAKLALLEKLESFLQPHRDRYQYFLDRPDEVMDILQTCGQKARAVARETVNNVRNAVGLI